MADESELALLRMVRDFSHSELAPRAASFESGGEFPRDQLERMSVLGILNCGLPETVGGAGLRLGLYLQVLEEVAGHWLTPALSVSVHTLACGPLLGDGSEPSAQRLRALLARELPLGAYCLSESQAGSDTKGLLCRATREGSTWRLNGTKAWITHAPFASFFTVFARTDPGSPDLSCFVVPAGTDGISIGLPERKMGLKASPTCTVHLDDVYVESDSLIGDSGAGRAIALAALVKGRLSIAALAVGLAQSALDYSLRYAMERTAFGSPLVGHQAIAFMLADMEASVHSARAVYRRAAESSHPVSARAASIAKLVATDAVMKVTTDAVQILGGAGYTEDHPVERYMREAKVMQIFEGTNQIQRLIISRDLQREAR